MLTPQQLQSLQTVSSGGTNNSPLTPDQAKASFTKVAPTNNSGSSNILSSIGNALTSSEQAVGRVIGQSAALNSKDYANSQSSNQGLQDQIFKTQQMIKENKAKGLDTSRLEAQLAKAQSVAGLDLANPINIAPDATTMTNSQALGNVAGVGLDVLSAGSYGAAARGAETGTLLTSAARKAATPIVADVAQKTLGTTLKDIGTKTAVRSATGAGLGYGYDVSQNLKDGKTGGSVLAPGMGTLVGGAVPLVIGGIQAGTAITKSTAPRIINSLVKPKAADFSYGKDPGRTVSELGITGNSLPDFNKNIDTAKSEIGQKLGDIYSSPANSGVRIDATGDIQKLDNAIQDAAKGGKNNQTIVTQLQNIKDSILYSHGVNADGAITRVSDTPLNVSNLTPQEAFNLKQVISDATQFTGRPSDDKTVNSVLKNIYSGIKNQLNTKLGVNNPEINKLNQQYADLTSASLAVKNRAQIVQRAALVSMPIKVGTAAGVITAASTGGAAIPAMLVGVTGAALDKALQSTAVKTRVAAWLGSQTPSTISKIIVQNPGIKTTLYRLVPKLSSQSN